MLGQVVVVAHPDGDLDMDPTTIFDSRFNQPAKINIIWQKSLQGYPDEYSPDGDSLKCPQNESVPNLKFKSI